MWEVIRTAVITLVIVFLAHKIYEHLQEVMSPSVVEVKRQQEYARIEKLIKPDMKEELADFIDQLRRV